MILYVIESKNKYSKFNYSFNKEDNTIIILYSQDGLISYDNSMKFVNDMISYLNNGNVIKLIRDNFIRIDNKFDPKTLTYFPLSNLDSIQQDTKNYLSMLETQKKSRNHNQIFIHENRDELEYFYYNVWSYHTDHPESTQIDEIRYSLSEISLRELLIDIDNIINTIDDHDCITWISIQKYKNTNLQNIYEKLINYITRERKGQSDRSMCFDIQKIGNKERSSTGQELRIKYGDDAFSMEKKYLIPEKLIVFNLDTKIKAIPKQVLKCFVKK